MKSQICNKSSDLCLNSLKLYDETEQEKLQNWWKTDSKNDSNKSTISLHISAYENSNETAAAAIDDGLNGNKLNANTKQIYTATSLFVFENPFEFPRQQNDKIFELEVSRFQSSQQLRNPAIISRKKPQRRRIAGMLTDSEKESDDSDSSTKVLASSGRKLVPPPTFQSESQSDRDVIESSDELSSSIIADPIMDLDITIYEEELHEYLEDCRLCFFEVTGEQKRVYRRLANCTGCASASSIDTATHIIVPPGEYSTNQIKLLKNAAENGKKVVQCEWLIECVQRQDNIDTQAYIYPGLGGNDDPDEIDTKNLILKINNELRAMKQQYKITQTMFATKILGRTQGHLSAMLKNETPPRWNKLNESGKETYMRMYLWLKKSQVERINEIIN